MASPNVGTLGALRKEIDAGRVRRRPVKTEIRDNLIGKLRANERLFPGIIGYDESVVPQIVNAVLSRHNFILLGLRGQAKTRILRALTSLLDEALPAVTGCEIHDDPLAVVGRPEAVAVEVHTNLVGPAERQEHEFVLLGFGH